MGPFGNGHDCIRGPAKGREVADSEKLSQAIALLDGGDTAGGERVLRDVCSRAPKQYEYCSVVPAGGSGPPDARSSPVTCPPATRASPFRVR